jgi:hypothetical protein
MKFHERFDIEVDLKEAQRRFVNRTQNDVVDVIISVLYERRDAEQRGRLRRAVASALGDRYDSRELAAIIGPDFLRNLRALEVIYSEAKHILSWDRKSK